MDERILQIPEKLIKRFGTRDPFEIANMLGYSVKFINTKKQKGFCKILLNNFFIFINENMGPQMQRMTCAHELGHLLLHRDVLKRELFLAEMEIFDITDQKELEANEFAASLLIDDEEFAASLLIDDEELLQLLREEYDVVTAASMLDVNVNMLMVKLLVMKNNGYSFDLPFNPKAEFMGTIEDRADSF